MSLKATIKDILRMVCPYHAISSEMVTKLDEFAIIFVNRFVADIDGEKSYEAIIGSIMIGELAKHCIDDTKKRVDNGGSSTTLTKNRFKIFLKKNFEGLEISEEMVNAIAASIEYMFFEFIELASEWTSRNGRTTLQIKFLKMALEDDEEMAKTLENLPDFIL